MPDAFMAWPTRRKKGTASSGKLFRPTQILCGTMDSGTSPCTMIASVEEISIAKAIGTRSRQRAANAPKRSHRIIVGT